MAELNNSGTGQWSETDANNTSLPPDGAPVGTFPNQAEGIWRAMMGALKRFWDRVNGTVTTTGSAGAYVYMPANTGFPTAYVQGETYLWRANFTSVGGDTLNVNALGAKGIYRAGTSGLTAIGAGDIQNGQMVHTVYDGNLNSGAGGFQVIGSSAAPIPSGTKMVFMQASAPAGWTQVTTINDSVIRVVNDGSGGSTGGSWTISGVTAGGHSLTQAELPNVNFTVADPGHTHSHNDPGHSHGVSDPGHNHAVDSGSGAAFFQAPSGGNTDAGRLTHNNTTGISINGNTTGITNVSNPTGITVSSGGSGSAHTHTISADGTWRPAYVNCLVASKN